MTTQRRPDFAAGLREAARILDHNDDACLCRACNLRRVILQEAERYA